MSTRYDCNDPVQREAGIEAAVQAIRDGGLVVLPTDTVYGIGADAFTPRAVSMLLAAKGRGRNMPPPVLVGTVRAANALVESFGAFGQDLIDEFWPGPLTLVFRAAPTLQWDLGDTMGTVAVRMPLHPVALEVLKQAGPTAVSSANLTGSPAATTAEDAQAQLGASVSVYLDGGPCATDIPSTILDLTGTIPRVLRTGAISVDRLRKVAAIIDDTLQPEPADVKPADAVPGEAEPADVKPADVKPAEPHPLAGATPPPPAADAPSPAPGARTRKSSRSAGTARSPRAPGSSGSSRAAGSSGTSQANGTPRASRAAGTSKPAQANGTPRASRAAGTSKPAQAADASKPRRPAGTSKAAQDPDAPRPRRAAGTSKSAQAADGPKPRRAAGTSRSSRAAGTSRPSSDGDTPQPPAEAG